ncbi:MAG: DEAD/DEAH box helicase, partial [bacterium]|nr:DEAD/DEAH box helicase [bacterium]
MQPTSTSPQPRRRDAADGAVDSWIESVVASATRVESNAPRDHLRYAVEVAEQFYVPRFTIAAFLVSVGRDGVSTSRRYDLPNLATASAKHVTQADRIIGRLVNASGLIGGLTGPAPVVTGTLLLAMVRTGRLHWRDVTAPPLRYEPLDGASLAWTSDEDGRQRLHVAGHPGTVLVPTIPLWYVDPDLGTTGPVETRVAPDLGALLASAPSLTPDQARRVYAALRRIVDGDVGLPDVGDAAQHLDREPTPVLRVSASHGAASLDLRFAYDDRLMTQRDDHEARNIAFEMQAAARIAELTTTPLADERAWLRFIAHTAPRLRREGWTVEVDERFPYDVVEAQDVWRGEIVEGAERWFDVDLGVDVAGERVALLPLIMAALAENGIGDDDDLSKLATRAEPLYARLPSGSYVALPAARVARVLAMLAELFGENAPLEGDGRLRVSRSQAAALAELERGLRIEWRGMEHLRALLDDLTVLDGESLSVPPEFTATLRPYQREGVAWLQALATHGFGGVLADDMGLGKTVQFLAHAAIERAAGRLDAPILIVAPTSVAPNWRA